MSIKLARSAGLKALYNFISGFIGILTLGYAALAVYAFLETRKLMANKNSFEVDNGTLFVPFVWSLPEKIYINGAVLSTTIQYVFPASNETLQSLTFSHAESRGRERLDSLVIMSTGVSLIFSAFASVMFVFVTSCMRSNVVQAAGTTSSFSITFFFSLVLVQTGFSTGAMVEQNRILVNYFQELVDEFELDLTVESYTNSTILISAALGAFAVVFFVLVDAILHPCCQSGRAKNTIQRDGDDEKEFVVAEEGIMQRQTALIVEDASQSSILADDPSSPTLTSSERPPWSSMPQP